MTETPKRRSGSEPEKWRELFERCYPNLIRVARAHAGAALKGKEEPEDLAQTACRRVIQDLEKGATQWKGEKEALNYLLKVMKNKVIDKGRYYRAERRDLGREQALGEELGLKANQETPSVIIRAKDRNSRVERAVASLPEDLSGIVRSYYLDGATLEHISQSIGKSVGSVRHSLKKGLEALQSKLTEGL